jgi:hypothetical protein
VVGDDRADRVALAVVRLLPEQDEVRALCLQDPGQRVAGGADVGALERRVGQVDGAVGAERHRLVQGADGAFGPHGDRHDLLHVGVAALADLHRGLDPMCVERVQVLLAGAVEALRLRVDALLDRRVGNLLDEAADLQLGKPSLGCFVSPAGGSARRDISAHTQLTDQSIGGAATATLLNPGDGFGRVGHLGELERGR